MDAGPIWATRTFPLDSRRRPARAASTTDPSPTPRIELIHEVVAKAADPAFVPEPLDYGRADVDRPAAADDAPVRPRVLLVRPHRRRSCAGSAPPTARPACARRCAASRCRCSTPIRGPALPPASRAPSCAAATGPCSSAPATAAIWIGHVRRTGPTASGPEAAGHHRPRRSTGRRVADVPSIDAPRRAGYREISYRRVGAVGVLDFDFYNGAMSTGAVPAARRGAAARRRPGHQGAGAPRRRRRSPTASTSTSSTRRRDPAVEAWRNINAIDDVCREIITCTRPARRGRRSAATPAPAA